MLHTMRFNLAIHMVMFFKELVLEIKQEQRAKTGASNVLISSSLMRKLFLLSLTYWSEAIYHF